jgi:hypothetical protein
MKPVEAQRRPPRSKLRRGQKPRLQTASSRCHSSCFCAEPELMAAVDLATRSAAHCPCSRSVHDSLALLAFSVAKRRRSAPDACFMLLLRSLRGTTIIAGIASCFVLVRRAGRTRVDHLGAVNRCRRALSNIGAHCISIIRGKDRAGGTRVGALRCNKQKTNQAQS